jgi:fibronectin type 3 domain-containing protein
LNWTASTTSGITSYNIYRASVSGGSCGTFSVYDSAAASATSYTDQTVTDGNGYCYGTTAVDSSGESTMSNEVQVAIPAP